MANNELFLKELAVRHFQRQLLRPIYLSLENIGIIGVRDVYIDISLQSDQPFFFVSEDSIIDSVSQIKSPWRLEAVDVDKSISPSDRWNTFVEIPAIQPKRVMFLDLIGFLGCPASSVVEIACTIYGDCFPEPLYKKLLVDFFMIV